MSAIRCSTCVHGLSTLADLCNECATLVADAGAGIPAIKTLMDRTGCGLNKAVGLLAEIGKHAPEPAEPKDFDECLRMIDASGRKAHAIEALWDGDTTGWGVELAVVVNGTEPGEQFASLHLDFLRGVTGDFRIFRDEVPPWPEALEATRLGEKLAQHLSVPFHFPSPAHPEDECPHWWQLASSKPCSDCGVPLIQNEPCPWKGTCYRCHLRRERSAES